MSAARVIRSRRRGLWPLLVIGLVVVAALAGLWVLRVPDDSARISGEANSYVALALAVGRIEPGSVDGYFGPPGLAPPADQPAPKLAEVRARASGLLGEIERGRDPAIAPRRVALANKVRQLIALIDVIQAGASLPFDDEARRLYGIAIGPIDDRPRNAALAELAVLLPGKGPLADRVAAFRARLVVPEPARPAVFARALDECRRRTLAHWSLPSNEHVELRWTGAVPAAWHHYQDGGRSLLEINPTAVAFVGAAIDTACHEAYPGHHAQFVAMNATAGPAGLPVERTVTLLRSPETLLREGAANFGVRLAFPLGDRATFARDVLYPLAGLPPGDAAKDMRVHQLLGDLEMSVVPILRAYRDGRLPFDATVAALRNDALIASPEALLSFVDQYGAQVLGYTIARDRVAGQVAARSARTHRDPWAVLRDIVATADTSALATVPTQGELTVMRFRHRLSRLAPSLAAGILLVTPAPAIAPSASNIYAAFARQNDAAMNKMMADMVVKPTGQVDVDFVAMMIPHHQGAIDMARAVLRYGRNEKLNAIARGIVAQQTAEIALMRASVGGHVPVATGKAQPHMMH